MTADNLFIGIDNGTQGTKAVVVSELSKEIIAQSYASYKLIENEQGGREQDPESWIDACQKVIAAVCANESVDPSQVRAIGVSGQQHGLVPLDVDGHVIRPAKLWCDTETIAETEKLTETLGGAERVSALIGNQIAVGFTASKILWLKNNEPENYSKLATVLLPHDYINFWLTGERKMEFGDASGTACFDVRTRTWSKDVLNAIDPSGKLESCLPELIEADAVCGWLKPELAEQFGLPVDVIVSSGGGDNMMGAIGTGNVGPGVVTANLGTSATIYAYSDEPVVDQSGELAAFCSSTGGWLPLVCTMNGTVTTELTRNLLDMDLDTLGDEIAATTPGAGGLIMLPYINGERTPALPLASGTLAGITSLNYNRGNVARAAMEGVTFGLRYGMEVMMSHGITPKEIRVVGGGAKSGVWRQIVANVFGCPVVSLENVEASALGAAMQSIWCWYNSSGGSGVTIQTLADRYVHLKEGGRHEPDQSKHNLYNAIYEKYLKLNSVMKSTY